MSEQDTTDRSRGGNTPRGPGSTGCRLHKPEFDRARDAAEAWTGREGGLDHWALHARLEVRRVRERFGLKSVHVEYLRLSFKKLLREDFEPGGCPPTVWISKSKLAEDLDVSPRTVSNIEKDLARAGFLYWTDTASRRRDGERSKQDSRIRWAHGVTFAPLDAIASEIEDAERLAQEEKIESKGLVHRISTKQSLELVSDPAGSLRSTVAAALKKPATLDRNARKLVQATARLSLLPDSGTLDVRTPSLERARELYRRLRPNWPTGPDTDKCSWHNLYDRMVRIHLPDWDRFGYGPDLSEAKELLGQRAFTVVAILALSRDNWGSRHFGLAQLCFESAIRVARAGTLDLDEIVSTGDGSGTSPANAAFTGPLKPIPDIHDIRSLIPETQWAPVSAEPGQRHGWASVIDNARRLGREALDIDDETWARLEDRIEPRGAAAAVLYAAPRPALAPEPRLIDRIARLKSRNDRNWSPGIHARALCAIEAEIDLAVVAALEKGEFQPAAPELLPGPDVVKQYGPRSIRGRIDDGAELNWDELTSTAHGLAIGRLHLSEDDWQRACRILGPRRAAAAALTAAAFEEEQNRRDFARIVFHEATRPGSLPELLRHNWLLYRSSTSFKVSDSVSVETGL